MAYYDIAGRLEISSASSQKEINERLLASFRSAKINAAIQGDNEVTFRVPFLKTLTGGYVFQGISSGLIKVKEANSNTFNVEYRLVTLPMRFFLISIVLWLMVGIPAISVWLGEGINIQSYTSFHLTGLAFLGSAILISNLFVRYKFVAFLRKSLSGISEVIRQPVLGICFDVKKIIVFSCSGVLFLALLIPATIFITIMGTQSKVVWRYPIANTVMSAPALSNGIAYFGSLNDVSGAAFYAMNIETGKEVWMKSLSGGVWSSPVLTDSSVCFAADDGFFRCLDRNNGEEQWQFGPEQRNLDAASCDRCALKLGTPAIDHDNIFVGSHDHNLYALDAKNGRLKWSFTANGSIIDAPAIVSGIVYAGSQDGYVYSLDSTTGTEIKRYFVPATYPSETNEIPGVYATPLIDANTIYAVNGSLAAIDIPTSEMKWQILGSSAYKDQVLSRPLAFDALIIVATTDALYAIDKSSGTIEWKYSNIKGNVFFSPILHNNFIYFGDSDGYLYKVDAKTGKQTLRYNMNYLDFSSYTNWFAEFVFPPAVDEHRIYVNWFNHLYAIQDSDN